MNIDDRKESHYTWLDNSIASFPISFSVTLGLMGGGGGKG